jgi:hypothetical protein
LHFRVGPTGPAAFFWLWLPLHCLGCRPARPESLTRDEGAGQLVAVAPVVRQPTVVAFWLPASDTLAKDEGGDLLDDFRGYTARIAPTLRRHDIELVGTTADSVIVELAAGPRRVIRLGGLDFPFGYVLVEPGFAETILTGVSTDDELRDQVVWYFGLDEDDADSIPGQVASAIELPDQPVSAFASHLEGHGSLERTHLHRRASIAGPEGPFPLARSVPHGRTRDQVIHEAAAVAHQVKGRT